MKIRNLVAVFLASSLGLTLPTLADEGLFGYLKGAEPNPKAALDAEQWTTLRSGKGSGHYEAWDLKTEIEYGATDRLTTELSVYAMGIDTSGLFISGYLPGDNRYSLKFSGAEAALKYNYLSAAKDYMGLSSYFALGYFQLDAHSGQKKDKYVGEFKLLGQKYFLDGELIAVGNLGLESTYANRKPIEGVSEDDWPTHPEMEIGFQAGAGLSYRFAPNWFLGAEVLYDTEFETEVGQERWSVQAGPTLHYGGQKFWFSLTWFPQLRGGGEKYDGQPDQNLHLIEKTEQEIRLKVGINF